MLNEGRTTARFDRYALAWVCVALVCIAAGVGLSPGRVIRSLPPKAESLRETLQSGVVLVRYAILGAGILALICAATWRLHWLQCSTGPEARSNSSDWLVAGILLIATVLSRSVFVGSSLWQDELRTLTVVRRGLLTLMTYSAGGNNHALNSALIWAIRAIFGEGEMQVRFPAFLLGAVTPPVLYLMWHALVGRRAALLTAVAALVHFSFYVDATEARGYAGALLFVCVAQAFFVRLIQRPSIANSAGYICSAAAAIGFIQVAILVPVAHGVAAAIVFVVRTLRGRSDQEVAPWKAVWFSAMWGVLLALIAFGILIVQTLFYARHGAERDHVVLSPGLLAGILEYLSGSQTLAIGIGAPALCAAGWVFGRSSLGLRVAFLAPVAMAAAWLLIPDGRYSTRLFFFVLPTVVMGIGLACAHAFERPSRSVRWLAAAAAGIFLAGMIPGYVRLLRVGNPNLKDLAAHLQGSHVVLLGAQADMNASYYFVGAPFMRTWPLTGDQTLLLQDADAIIEGYQVIDRDTHPLDLARLGFHVTRKLESWTPDQVSFLVYGRSATADKSARFVPARPSVEHIAKADVKR